MTLLNITARNGQVFQFDTRLLSNVQVVVDPSVSGDALMSAETTFNTNAATMISGRKIKHNL